MNARVQNYLKSKFAVRELTLAFGSTVNIRLGWKNIQPNVIRCMKTCGGDKRLI